MRNLKQLTLISALQFIVSFGNAQTYNILDYGAVPDGLTLNSEAIQKTIDACAEAGGGTVLVPAGTFVTGPIFLKDNIHLEVGIGAQLKGSKDLSSYRRGVKSLDPNRKGGENGLILADSVKNIAITGLGIINGNKVFNPNGEEMMRGPHCILITNSEKITIRDVRVYEGSNYNFMFIKCTDLNIDGISARGGWDGISLYYCTNVTINNANIQSGDDAIAGKGWKNVAITNCVLNSSCNGMRIYGLADQVRVNNCIIRGPGKFEHRSSKRNNTITGVTINTGRDTIQRNIHISNITMENVRAPFWMVPRKGAKVSDISFSDIYVTNAGYTGSYICGHPDIPIQNLTFRNIYIETEGGGTNDMAEFEKRGLVAGAWSLMPVYGLYCNGIENLVLDNVKLVSKKPEMRSAFQGKNISGLEMYRFQTPITPDAEAPVVLENVTDLSIGSSFVDEIENNQFTVKSIALHNNWSANQNEFFETETINADVSVKANSNGLAKVEIEIAGKNYHRWTYLEKGISSVVKFEIPALPAGNNALRANQLSKDFTVLEQPEKAAFKVLAFSLHHVNSDNYILSNIEDDILFNDQLEITAEVKNYGQKTGSISVPFKVNGKTISEKNIEVAAGETGTVTFEYKTGKAGEYTLQTGDLPVQKITVAEKLNTKKYEHFASTEASFAQIGEKYRIRAEGRNLMALGINDLYASLYKPAAMKDKTTVTVKIDSPNLRGGVLKSRMGIMVRNDITKDMESPGYLFIGMSHNNGCSMEWDSDANGKIDSTTELSDYTQWPCYLKLEKAGQTFTGYHSLDGKNWRKIGEITDPAANEKQDVGMFVCGTVCVFEEFNIETK